ncbi:hypothetical protein B0H14DRAFT_3888011 [Mycena olivaceomarginata]|nr:hypothetical protein B0H14DRAFT_3888011 [Mycena olivaceomarginata]
MDFLLYAPQSLRMRSLTRSTLTVEKHPPDLLYYIFSILHHHPISNMKFFSSLIVLSLGLFAAASPVLSIDTTEVAVQDTVPNASVVPLTLFALFQTLKVAVLFAIIASSGPAGQLPTSSIGANDEDLDVNTALNKLVPKLGLDGLLTPVDAAVSGLLVSLDASLVPSLHAALQPFLVSLGGIVGGLLAGLDLANAAVYFPQTRSATPSQLFLEIFVAPESVIASLLLVELLFDFDINAGLAGARSCKALPGRRAASSRSCRWWCTYAKLFLLGSTPRSVYGIKYGARSVAWGTTFPGITLLVVIALVYSVISPIIDGLACFTFFAFYQLYKYLFLWQFEQPPSSHTGGLFFPKAITHIFVGLYIQQVCMAGLFFLARDQNQNMSSTPQAILMIALIVITVLFQMLISNSFGPLKHALPPSLADKTFSAVPGGERSETTITNNGAQEAHEMTEPKGPGGVKRASTMQETENEEYEGLTDQQKAGNRAARVKSEEEYGFAHPAASRPQRIVCFPHDRLGLAAEEERGCREAGVECSVKARGVDIVGAHPDFVSVDE